MPATDTPETPVETTAEAGDPKPAARKYRLNWHEHTLGGEQPVHVCRIRPGGRQLQISLMSFLEHKLGDKPLAGLGDTVYVHLCSFGLMPCMASFSLRSDPDDREQLGWLAFHTVVVFDKGEAPLDPEQGPLTTAAERVAAVLRSYPVAVDMLKAYCDDLFDPYEGENLGAAFDAACDRIVAGMKPAATQPAYDDVDTAIGPRGEDVVMPSSVMRLLTEEQADLVTLADADPETLLSKAGGVTTVTIPGGRIDGGDLVLPWTGLNHRDAAEKALDEARTRDTAVILRHNGGEVTVQPGWTIDEVVDQLPY